MKFFNLLVVLSLVLLARVANASRKFEKIVVLMEENRSFDHMLGYLNRINPKINGLTGTEYNPVNTSNPSSSHIRVSQDAPYISPYDPHHDVGSVTEQIYGKGPNANLNQPVLMNGFVQNAGSSKVNEETVMQAFDLKKIPVITTLAENFALFDNFFASVPGPTYPNRMYFLAGTSNGAGNNTVPEKGWPAKTIFQSLNEKGVSWKIYYSDVSLSVQMFTYLRTTEAKKHVAHISEFEKDVKEDKLPDFAFIEPRYAPNKETGERANDQHPDHDVSLGEELMRHIYETIRGSHLFEKVLLFITYDEHGGFFDHVHTPTKNVPNPDGLNYRGEGGVEFNFDRLGIRIPTIAISPYIPKGTLISSPKVRPTPDSEFNLASFPATLKENFDLANFLTKRDAWSPGFLENIDWLDTPRKDCPLHLPHDPKTTLSFEAEIAQPVNELQSLSMDMFKYELQGHPELITDKDSLNQGQVGPYLEKMMKAFLQK